MKDLSLQEEYDDFVKGNSASLVYISTPACSVCKVLKPKIVELIKLKFPKIKMGYVDSQKLPEVAAQNRIFSVPTIIIYFDGKEFIRKSRNIGLAEFCIELERPYKMFFEN